MAGVSTAIRSVSEEGGRERLAAVRALASTRDLDVVVCVEPAEVLALSGFDLVGTFYSTAVLVPAEGEPRLFTLVG
jgi:hypothetical protein